MSRYSDASLATALLTSHAIKRPDPPLSVTRFWDVVRTVEDPGKLLGLESAAIAQTLGCTLDDARQVEALLSTATALAFELEGFERSGIRLVTAFDDDYPAHLIERLGAHAPPLLHVAGSSELLGIEGVGVVGSRNVGTEAREIADQVARAAVRHRLPVISGVARGIDQVAMAGALDAEGRVVGIPADAMDRLLRDASIRRASLNEQFSLATPYSPRAGFSVGTAMARNKLIYALARVTVVVTSDRGKGGTWTGALESIEKGYGPVAVWMGEGAGDGNSALVARGGLPIHNVEEIFSIARARDITPKSREQQLRLGL